MARRPVPPILRQKYVWPKHGEPVGAEITVVLKELEERITAVAEYYGVEPGDTPEWEETLAKAAKRFEGLEPRGYSGQDADPDQAIKDLILVYSAQKAGSVTKAAEQYAEHWGANAKALRSRYYKLTRPRTKEDRRASRRMYEMAARSVSVIQDHQRKK